jgi:hypothetical protein
MKLDNEALEKMFIVMMKASVSAKSNELLINDLFKFINDLIHENNLDVDEVVRRKLHQRIEDINDQAFYSSEFARQFPEYVAAADNGGDFDVSEFLNRLNGE